MHGARGTLRARVRGWVQTRAGTARFQALAAVTTTLAVVGSLAVFPATGASATSFDTDSNGVLQTPTTAGCPTLTDPLPYQVWFNFDDMDKRGYYDPLNQTAWDFPKRIAQIICGAREGSQIKIGMYFIRAIGTMTQPGLKDASDPDSSLGSRPESDPEVIYDALEYVIKYRHVKVGFVLDGGSITPGSAKAAIKTRILTLAGARGMSTVSGKTDGLEWCRNGCFNTNASKVFPYAINHEKFVTISDTIWDGAGGAARSFASAYPAVISSSGNWARSQTRNYLQEMTLVYGDREMFKLFSDRYDGMTYCANTGCHSGSKFPASLKKYFGKKKDRNIWVDRFSQHGTDAGRGTVVTFSPQPSTVKDPYIAAFDNVNCKVDKQIRIAMFKLTDSKAEKMVKALARLKSRGCNVKMLLTQQGGSTTISKKVVKQLKKAKIGAKCTPIAMHTKVIIIGGTGTDRGRVMAGTANMSTAGLRYSEEHTLTFDVNRASAQYKGAIQRVYAEYLAGWYELSQGAKTCH